MEFVNHIIVLFGQAASPPITLATIRDVLLDIRDIRSILDIRDLSSMTFGHAPGSLGFGAIAWKDTEHHG